MRRAVSGQFHLELPAREAINLFTPEGERAWAPGWNPTYPAGELSESPGTVFITEHDGAETIWVIQEIDTDECTVAYSRVKSGHHAGTIRVTCEDRPAGGCLVSVSYDITLLPGADPHELDHYDDNSFDATMTHWSNAIRDSG